VREEGEGDFLRIIWEEESSGKSRHSDTLNNLPIGHATKEK